jgi:Kef-type K+ transport system membrane component KefB
VRVYTPVRPSRLRRTGAARESRLHDPRHQSPITDRSTEEAGDTLTALHEFFESELGYVVVLFLLFVVSRMLQRWRVPSAVTSFALGAAGAMGFGLFDGDKTLHLLSTFGIVALFLFAGLDVDVRALRGRAAVLTQHLVVRVAMLAVATYVAVRVYALDIRLALLIALALLTPSTGFILDSLPSFGLASDEEAWVKNKAIATELLALAVLFVALQSTSLRASAWPRSPSLRSS